MPQSCVYDSIRHEFVCVYRPRLLCGMCHVWYVNMGALHRRVYNSKAAAENSSVLMFLLVVVLCEGAIGCQVLTAEVHVNSKTATAGITA